jgi:urea transport system substrate-binding protein
MAGDYAAWNYFQTVDGASNRDFVRRYRARYGAASTTSDPVEAAYVGVHLWAAAVRDADSHAVSAVRERIARQSLHAPEGVVYVDPENRHTWKTVRIGRINERGQFDIVWSSTRPVRPVPYPIFRTREEWDAQLAALHAGWGGSWANPGAGR